MDSPGFNAGAGFSLSNTAVLVLGALAGGCLAYHFFKNGDVHLKSESALTNQDYIEDEIYQTMEKTAAYPATVRENEDRIRDLIRRNKSDAIRLGHRLRRKRLSPRKYREALRAMATHLNSDLGISQIDEF